MAAFLEWLNGAPRTIHPFDDGNGGIARVISDMCLARSGGTPQRFYSMSTQIHPERAQYYRVLEQTQKDGPDITSRMCGSWAAWNVSSAAPTHP